MNPDRERELIELIASSEPEHWDCPAVIDALARYVDSQLDGDGSEPFDPGLAEHLKRCPPCEDLHAALLEVARLDAEEGLPSASELWSRLGASQATDRRAPSRSGAPEPAPRARLIQAPDRFRRWLIPAASVAALLALSFGWRGLQRSEAQQAARMGELTEQVQGLQARLAEAEAKALAAETGIEETRRLADEARELAGRNEATIELISRLDRNALALRDDGSWIRVFYAEEGTQAVVYIGDMQDMPKLEDGQYLECWLQDEDGVVYSAGIADTGAKLMDHWTFQAPRPLGEHSAFMVTIEPEHRPIFEVPLGRDG